MSKIKWECSNIYATEPGVTNQDSCFEYWHTNYGDIFAEILPTNIIHGNKDFGKEECKWVVNICVYRKPDSIWEDKNFYCGASFGSYKSILAAKRDANKCILALVEKGR